MRDGAVVQQGCHRGGVAEQLPPIIDRAIRREKRGGTLVAPHDQLQQVFGGRVSELPHAEVVDDQQRHGRKLRKVVLAGASDRRLREVLQRVGS